MAGKNECLPRSAQGALCYAMHVYLSRYQATDLYGVYGVFE